MFDHEEKFNYPKHDFRYITYLVKKEGDELKIVDTKITPLNNKQYIAECIKQNRKPIIVNKKPDSFLLNEQYMLLTRDRIWTWQLIDEPETA